MRSDDLEFDWPDTGKLTIHFDSPRTAVLSYRPSKKVVFKHLLEAAQGRITNPYRKVTPITSYEPNEATGPKSSPQEANGTNTT